jgi:copper chaperone CopZ
MRTRPIFPEWQAVIEITFDDEQVNKADIERAIADTGSKVGLCDYRPKFGRFEVL